MNSLRFRLIATYGALVALAALSTWYVTDRVVTLEMTTTASGDVEQFRRAISELSAHRSTLVALSRGEDVSDAQQLPPLVLFDTEGAVIFENIDGAVREVALLPDGGVHVEFGLADLNVNVLRLPESILVTEGLDGGSVRAVPVEIPDQELPVVIDGNSLNWMRWLGVGLAVLAFFGLLGISNAIFKPVGQLKEAARKIAAGDFDVRISVKRFDEIGSLGLALNEMARRLSAADKLRKNVASDIAHELRTPLTNIKGQVEALQDGLLDESQASPALIEECYLLERLVDDLHVLTLADTGQLRMVPALVNVKSAMERAARAVDPDGSAGLKVEAEPGLSAYVDPDRLQQILRNLLSNAMRHSPEVSSIEMTASNLGAAVELSVSDRGAGIPEGQREQVFERFYRVDTARGREAGGRGLGLSIVKQLVELSGGTVGARTNRHSGATFHLTLPTSG